MTPLALHDTFTVLLYTCAPLYIHLPPSFGQVGFVIFTFYTLFCNFRMRYDIIGVGFGTLYPWIQTHLWQQY